MMRCSYCRNPNVLSLGYCKKCYKNIQKLCIVLNRSMEPGLYPENLQKEVKKLPNGVGGGVPEGQNLNSTQLAIGKLFPYEPRKYGENRAYNYRTPIRKNHAMEEIPGTKIICGLYLPDT